MERGIIFVVSGPSGSGKGTVNKVLCETGRYYFSVSRTTRAPRAGEVDGRDYFFVSRDDFLKYINEGDFLEYNEYCGTFYGTPKSVIEEKLASGVDVILEIDVNGAENVKKAYPEAVLIMLLPPSFSEQEKRLRERGTESDEVIAKRLGATKKELEKLDIYDYIVYNRTGHQDEAVDAILSITKAEHCSKKRAPDAAKKYFEN